MDNQERRKMIWAIGGGKGGTGKSFITSCIGTCLAQKGYKTVILDADLGGANIHTFFGMIRPRYSLTDFFDKKVPLQDIIAQSGIPNLQLIAGTIGSLDSENINHAQKQKLFRQIKAIDAEVIVIDLGAGTHISTLDTFLLADRMIVVTVPEVTALENMYQFIKSVYFRKLKAIFKTYSLNALIQDTWKERATYNIQSFKDLIAHLKQSSDEINGIFANEMSGFIAHIVLNQVRTPRDIIVGENLKSVCTNFLGLPVVYSGYASYDAAVIKSVNSREPFMLCNRLSPIVNEIKSLTENIITGTHHTVRKDILSGSLS